ncbi:hypothetical protein [Luteimonas aquatica]|uniref:hypothetical protein n=1 Tax=Luteimonas aquatica TaxID=450364 RepID=UPI001F5A23FD|nr:hypothetical protein [Luteimonas aquatica]
MSQHKRHPIHPRDSKPRQRGVRGNPVPAAMPEPEEAYYRGHFRDAPYYSSGRDWNDYAPAYRYAYLAHAIHGGRRFADVEPLLARDWGGFRGASRLLWVEARGAVQEAWRHLDEQALLRSGAGR